MDLPLSEARENARAASDAPASARIGLPVSFKNISKRFGATPAVDDVTLDVRAGEFLALLGPSGSGKSTLLMILAGFETPTAGRVHVGGRDLTDLPANRREIGMVFQRYALFPHMTVAQNVDFPLRMRRLSTDERRTRVARALDMVQLAGFEQRLPSQLSGGQQQRVALARALVFNPPVLLMDEPLGALDRKLRRHMQLELTELKERLGATVIYVTHDQEEALAMADRVAILHQGRIEQIDAPRRLYEAPRTAFVAGFMGDLNQFEGRVVSVADSAVDVSIHGCSALAMQADGAAPLSVGAPVIVGVRPEHLHLTKANAASENGLRARIVRSSFSGADISVFAAIEDGPLVQAIVRLDSPAASLRDGENVSLSWPRERAVAFSGSAVA